MIILLLFFPDNLAGLSFDPIVKKTITFNSSSLCCFNKVFPNVLGFGVYTLLYMCFILTTGLFCSQIPPSPDLAEPVAVSFYLCYRFPLSVREKHWSYPLFMNLIWFALLSYS